MRTCVLVVALAVAVALGPSSASAAQTSNAAAPAMPLTYKGFNYVSFFNGGFEDADSLPALAGTGANAAALVLEYGIDVQNSAVYSDATFTDSLAALAAAIREARGLGLTVMVRPLIDFLDPAKIGSYAVGDWRSTYNPTDAAAFLASYKAMIVSVAQVTQANGATVLCIGTEIDQLTGPAFKAFWTDIIAAVRQVFSGTLAYSADWDDAISPWQGLHGLPAGTGNIVTQVSFWSELDFVGIDAYAPISDAANPTLAQLIAGWTQVPSDPTSHAVTGNQSLISYFASVAAQAGKPMLFTEIGYESASDAALNPAGPSSTNVFDPALQSNLYTAFFTAWAQSGNRALAGVFFWDWDPNAAEVGPANGVNFSPQAEPAQTVATTFFTRLPPADSHDFDSNGHSDIAWRDDAGNIALWLMSGAQVAQAGGLGAVATSWQIVGQRDVNGDGRHDLVWRDSATGAIAIWLLNGLKVRQTGGLGTIAGTWTIAGTGDFDGDGHGDLLWRESASGAVAIWLLNGLQVQQAGGVGTVPSTWTIAGTGDFDADGMTDILWRDASGAVAIWLMHGIEVAQSGGLATVPTSWTIVATGDFNGDGKSDILWRDRATGTVAVWLLNGVQIIQTGSLGSVPATWTVAQTGDFNGDGTSDIVWRDASGDVAIWFMNGLQIAATASLGTVSTSWTIQGINAD